MPALPVELEGLVEQPMRATEDVDQPAGLDGNGGGQRARARTDPGVPTLEQLKRHMLTHLPYCDPCPVCVASHKPNTNHRKASEHERTMPFLVVDDCFPKSSSDDTTITVLVLKPTKKGIVLMLG